MSAGLVAGARRLLARETGPDARLDALTTAVALARGRVDDAVVDEAAAVAERASQRLRLSGDHTVVAIAGATGSGKSSTFNALAGLELSAVGVRRPTTSRPTACVWDEEGPGEGGQGESEQVAALLDWLDVPPRHRAHRGSLLDLDLGLDLGAEPDRDQPREQPRAGERGHGGERGLDGVVLLDLPDHDSTEVAHHLEVERLVGLSDLLVWVLDPQKYADAAVHRRFLARLTEHQDVVLVALNQVDLLPAGEREAVLADVRRLLDADGLDRVPVLALSARDGEGIDALRDEVRRRAAAKRASRERVAADVRGAATRLDAALGDARPAEPSGERVDALHAALADAAGIPVLVEAVERSTRLRARRATGWPVLSWTGRLRRDPLRGEQRPVTRADDVQRAAVDHAARGLVDEVVDGLAVGTAGGGRGAVAGHVRHAATARLPEAPDRLASAVAEVPLESDRLPWWVRGVRALQWALLATALVGGLWLLALAGAGFLRLSLADPPGTAGLPTPTLLLLGGAAGGVVLAGLCRVLVGAAARARARGVERRLRRAVEEVASELVLAPLDAELTEQRRLREELARARR